jgi:uroporphyrinogen-III decarboxylase
MLRLFGGYRVQVVGWEDHRARSELERAQSYLRGAVSGGLSEMAHLLYGTPATVRDVARQALQRTQGRRFILAAGRPLLATTPLSNIQAVRDIVQTAVG